MIKFTCNKSDLHGAISNVSKAVAVKSTILALEGIKIKAKDNKLGLTGYDLELGIKTEIPAEVSESGEFVISSRLFSEIVRRMPDETVTVEVDKGLNTTISCGPTEYSIVALSAEEYPDIPSFNQDRKLTVSQSVLKNMINQTVFAVSVNENKPVLTGELFDIENGIFNLVAIDGFRLAIRKENVNTQEYYHFVVPAKALREISNLLKDEDDKNCVIYTGRKHIIFEIDGYSVISRLLEGEFHNYKGSVPEKASTEIIIGTRELINSLERCSLLINDRVKAPVKCLFDNDRVKISCTTTIGKVNDEIVADISGPMVEIGFNCKYLLEALKASESDKVKLMINGGLSPMKIVPLGEESYIFLVLPVRLKGE